ncbi:hypothetical protein M9434_005676 [Picochlorum sp. BPE23]|nr:hypothetical protein M9434_005676 [Picochlorum sp. BPE23]
MGTEDEVSKPSRLSQCASRDVHRLGSKIPRHDGSPRESVKENVNENVVLSSLRQGQKKALGHASPRVSYSSNTSSDSSASTSVKVVVRVRPRIEGEGRGDNVVELFGEEDHAGVVLHDLNGREPYAVRVDHAMGMDASQEDMFHVVGWPMVDHCMDGFNSTIFAYGQTGSGKTHTMMGSSCWDAETGELDREAGLIPRVFDALFAAIEEREGECKSQGKDAGESVRYSVKCSFLEIYNEEITDLLDPSLTGLQIRDGDEKRGVYVQGLSENEVLNADDVLKLIQAGSQNRSIAATRMNDRSSRSHSVFTATIEAHQRLPNGLTNVKFSKLNLIDLAGSERVTRSGVTGEQLTEARSINKSLTVLGRVISALVERQRKSSVHVPYRDSRLTFLLQESLGGNSKTAVVATVTPAAESSAETYCTLAFAAGAKKIKCRAVVNEDVGTDVKALQAENARLVAALEAKNSKGVVESAVESLERELEQIKMLFDQNSSVITALRAEQSIIQRELVESKASAARATQEASTLRASNVSLSNAFESLEEENSSLQKEIGNLLERLENSDAVERERDAMAEEMEKMREESAKEHADLVEQMRQAEVAHARDLESEKKKVEQLKKGMRDVQAEVDVLGNKIAELEKTSSQWKSEADTYKFNLKVMEDEALQEKSTRERLSKQVQEHLGEIERLKVAMEQKALDASEREAQLKDESNRLKSMYEESMKKVEGCEEKLAAEKASVAKYKRMVGEISRLVDWAQASAPGSAAAAAALAAASCSTDASHQGRPSPAAQAALRVARMNLATRTSVSSGLSVPE